LVQIAHKQKGGIFVYNLPNDTYEIIKRILAQECVLDNDSKVQTNLKLVSNDE
jgi:hypothetical protein